MNKVSFYGLPPKVYKVSPKLFAGPQLNYKELCELKKEGVNLVINFRRKNKIKIVSEKVNCLFLRMKQLWYPQKHKDEISEIEFYEKVIKRINDNPNKTYIHCKSGKHRTGLVVAAFKILVQKIKPKQAISELEQGGYWKIHRKNEAERLSQTEYQSQELKHFLDIMTSCQNNRPIVE